MPAPSGVPHQPRGDVETRLGAANRATHAAMIFAEQHGRAADFTVGLEGGVAERDEALASFGVATGIMESFAWMAVRSSSGRWGLARSATLQLPPAVAKLIRGGMELGHADDQVFGRTGSKTKEGAVGLLAHGQIDRAAYYAHPLILAMVPFVNGELF